MMSWSLRRLLLFLTILLTAVALRAAEPDGLAGQADQAVRRACDFFHGQVSSQGGYLWKYSADLKKREGEGRADAQTVWVQPPGTPAVGQAYLDVYQQLGDNHYLQLARTAGQCLIDGQLRSGGWDYRIELDPARRRRTSYRVDPGSAGRNTTTLDDDTTQSALRFLIRLDEALEFQDPAIHNAAQVGLAALLAAQYPNGAWPQRFEKPADPAEFPVLQASYPETWPREWPAPKYADYYTLNDNTLVDTIDLMLLAAAIYEDPRYRRAAMRGADFLLLAQMPDPQPGWAQQYDRQMQPAWARKFEPPAISGSESAGAIRCLLRAYSETGQRKYLDAAGRGLEYYRRVRLPAGGLARFYELKTDRPLYFTKTYELTYDNSDVPTHYSFEGGDWTAALTRQHQTLTTTPTDRLRPAPVVSPRRPAKMSASLAARARQTIDSLDARGAWVEAGRLRYHGDDDETREVIDCRTFAENIRLLAGFIAAARADG